MRRTAQLFSRRRPLARRVLGHITMNTPEHALPANDEPHPETWQPGSQPGTPEPDHPEPDQPEPMEPNPDPTDPHPFPDYRDTPPIVPMG